MRWNSQKTNLSATKEQDFVERDLRPRPEGKRHSEEEESFANYICRFSNIEEFIKMKQRDKHLKRFYLKMFVAIWRTMVIMSKIQMAVTELKREVDMAHF